MNFSVSPYSQRLARSHSSAAVSSPAVLSTDSLCVSHWNKQSIRDRATDRLNRGGRETFFFFSPPLSRAFHRDLSQQLVHSSLEHFCVRRPAAEADSSGCWFFSSESLTVFDLARKKLFTVTECTMLDGWEGGRKNYSSNLFNPFWHNVTEDKASRWPS